MDNPLQNRWEKGQQCNRLIKSIRSMFIKEDASNNLDEIRILIGDIEKAKKDWMNANMCFEFAEEAESVDYYIYHIKACEVKYQHLLKKAKEKGIKVGFAEMPNSLYAGRENDFHCKV